MRDGRSLGVLGGRSVFGTPAPLAGQDEDIDAISQYMAATPAKTSAARKKQDEYRLWIDGVSWWDKNYDRPTFDHARNLRNEFNLANATTASEQQAVQTVLRSGVTTEEARGEARRASPEGRFSEEDAGVGAPSLPGWAIWTLVGAAGLGVLYGLGKVTTLAEIFSGKKGGKKQHAANGRGRVR